MPVAVVEGVPSLETVCAANSPARRIGIKRGLSRAELDSFSGLCVLRRSPAEERSARTVLHELAASFTPRFQDTSQDNRSANGTDKSQDGALLLALDMTGNKRVFGPIEMLHADYCEPPTSLVFRFVWVQARISMPQCAWRGHHQSRLPFSSPARKRPSSPGCPSTRFTKRNRGRDACAVGHPHGG